MISVIDIENKIKKSLDVKHIEVVDLRGGDHILAIVVSPQFENKSLMEQHKMIYDILANEIASSEIHALTLKTYLPVQWEKIKGTFSRDIGHAI